MLYFGKITTKTRDGVGREADCELELPPLVFIQYGMGPSVQALMARARRMHQT